MNQPDPMDVERERESMGPGWIGVKVPVTDLTKGP